MAATIDCCIALVMLAWDWLRARLGRREHSERCSIDSWGLDATPMAHLDGGARSGVSARWLLAPVAFGAAVTMVFFGGQAFGGTKSEAARFEVQEPSTVALVINVPVTESAVESMAVATDAPATAIDTLTPTDTATPEATAVAATTALVPPTPPAAAAAAAAPVETVAPTPAPATAVPATALPAIAAPVTVPKGQQYSEGDVRSFAAQAGWPAPLIDQVIEVARCESGFNSGADGGGPLGLMQLMPGWFGSAGVELTNWSDAVSNLRVARFVYNYEAAQGHSGWAAWSCAPAN
ncbi:MAG: hypothetical protein ABI305_05535 [Tepidiformaceae bacterium]